MLKMPLLTQYCMLTATSSPGGVILSADTAAAEQVKTPIFLTWLPSFCQKTAGGGLPFVPQRKVTVRPGVVIWSRGRTTIWGGTAGEETVCLKSTGEIIRCK